MIDDIRNTPEDKAAFNARAKASMREFLGRKSWKEKVESIARMNAAAKIARASMRKARTHAPPEPATREPTGPETHERA